MMSIYLIKTLIILQILKLNSAEYIPSSHYLNLKPSFDYEKYSIGLNKHKIPTLENLFQIVTYWDVNNSSSPCKHDGKKRSSLCQKVVSFDQAGYDKSLKDTKQLILNRLNLKEEPEIKMNKNTLNFIDQLENNIIEDTFKRQHSTIKTKYDMKTSENKVLTTMHEALSVSNCENSDDSLEESESLLCIHFEIPLKNFYKVKDTNNIYVRKLSSVTLWIFLRTQLDETNENQIELKIQSLNSKTSITLDKSQLVDGWNTVNVTHLFQLPTMNAMTDYSNKTQSLTISLDCGPFCTIGYSIDDLMENLESNFRTLLLSNSPARKPLISIKILEERDGDLLHFDKTIRNKRKTFNHNPNINYKAYGIDRDNYNPRLCYNNYPDSNRECCLITYFVNFNSLKWSSWILHPPGFVANYCSGKCNDLKSFKYAGHNAEVKLKYNERLLSKETFDAGEMLETCCHPISMDSLVIKYLATNGSVVSTVIPNMIITGCGCS